MEMETERTLFLRDPTATDNLAAAGFECVGVRERVFDKQSIKEWVFVRPGIKVFPRSHSIILVFDLNHVLGVKWFDPSGRWHCPSQVHARCDQQVFFLRPGAKKLLRLCKKATFDVYIWTTMQYKTASTFIKGSGLPISPDRILTADDCDWSSPQPHSSSYPIKNLDVIRNPGHAATIYAFDDDPQKFHTRHQPFLHVVPKFEPTHPYDHKALTDKGCEWMLREICKL